MAVLMSMSQQYGGAISINMVNQRILLVQAAPAAIGLVLVLLA